MLKIGIVFDRVKWIQRPFDKRYSYSYRILSKVARQHGIEVYISDLKNYRARKFAKCWFCEKSWKILRNRYIDMVFDKMSTSGRNVLKRMRVRMMRELPIVNHPELNEISEDKYLSYTIFREYFPKTYLLSTSGIRKAPAGLYVMKPRHGSRGEFIRIMEKEKLQPKKDFIFQEFIDTSGGIKDVINKVHDLRLVSINGKIIKAYLRVQKKGIINNMDTGEFEIHIEKSKVPESAVKIFRIVDRKLSKYDFRFYTIDFLVDKDQKPWICELNTHLGLGIAGKKTKEIYFNMYREILLAMKRYYLKLGSGKN
ncbi:MAG: ATP-grasp domain-containing protein [Candidatus Aenigmarchaeota archaeon]|nr:ATP-grasp domain-containing protein [Candidatus Aenigmarchaeota archaeon]